jgi:hypothetical protein
VVGSSFSKSSQGWEDISSWKHGCSLDPWRTNIGRFSPGCATAEVARFVMSAAVPFRRGPSSKELIELRTERRMRQVRRVLAHSW